MAKRKITKSDRKNKKRPTIQKKDTIDIEFESDNSWRTNQQEKKSRSIWRKPFVFGVFVLAIILIAILYRYKNLVVAAFVNGQPIMRRTLDSKLMERYGKNTLDGLIGEALIMQEAQKQEITVSSNEIDNEIEKTKATLPQNTSLEDFLQFQGIPINDFRNQIRIRLLVNKLLSGKTKITDEEIASYMEKNKDTLTSTNEADLKIEAKEALSEQKVQKQFQTWYQNVRKNATIKRYL